MNAIGSNRTKDLNPSDELSSAENIVDFISYVADSFGFHDAGSDMGKQGWDGLATILRDLRDRLAATNEVVIERITEPYAAGYRAGSDTRPDEYKRGYREGLAATQKAHEILDRMDLSDPTKEDAGDESD